VSSQQFSWPNMRTIRHTRSRTRASSKPWAFSILSRPKSPAANWIKPTICATHHPRREEAFNESTKHQVPSSQHQCGSDCAVGIWCLEFLWSLVLGAWCFSCRGRQSMNGEAKDRTSLAYLVAVLGAFLIVAGLVWAMHRYTQPPPLGQNRAAERAKALAELRAAEKETLDTMAWINQSNGIVRLRLEDAMNVVLREWQNPAAARSNLLARTAKAYPPPPPPPKSAYE